MNEIGIKWQRTLDAGRNALYEVFTFQNNTLRLLARFQGQEINEWRDEQPGKILHELRAGESARLGEIPHNPYYYGTVDATLLFLVLLARHAAWTGDLTLFHALRENIERALTWIDRYGDSDGDGFLDYRSTTLVTAFLGLKPEAFEHRLRIVRPVLPEDVDRIRVRRLRVGDAYVDINFERASGGQTTVNVIALDGELDVTLEAELKRRTKSKG